ncbi:MAG TPA: ABC transporter substrate-binding protein [Chloroflexota bacterium]|nr:ABC transporter substrate-binding protein [Chloroflexota bacterium]
MYTKAILTVPLLAIVFLLTSATAMAQTVPFAHDGQRLNDQSSAIQAMFRTVWGDLAAERWVDERNTELAAAQTGHVVRIAYFASGVPTFGPASEPGMFMLGLREHGYVPGENVTIDWRFGEGQNERLAGLAAELAQLSLDAIAVSDTQAVLAIQQAMPTTPIVITMVSDPVGAGLVASLERPGGNVTGVAGLDPKLSAKRLELLTQALPGVSQVAVLRNAGNPSSAGPLRDLAAAAETLHIRLISMDVRASEDLPSAFEAATGDGAEAIIGISDILFASPANRAQLIQLAERNHLPMMHQSRPIVDEGGLMSFSPRTGAGARRAADYLDRIVKGAKPADLPMGVPTDLELVINLRGAEAIGIDVPAGVLAQASEVLR